jgi:acyl-CoA thioesterase FadM
MSLKMPLNLLLSSVASPRYASLTALVRACDHHYQNSHYHPLPWYSETELWQGVALPESADAFCVSQSIKSHPFEHAPSSNNLVSFIMSETAKHTQSSSPTTPSCIFEAAMGITKVGNSSITYEHEISAKAGTTLIPLASMSRTFVRVDGRRGKPLRFSAEERGVLEELQSRNNLLMTEGEGGGGIAGDSSSAAITTAPFSTVITNRHTNFGSHVDHAALIDIVLDAFFAVKGGASLTSFDIVYVNQSKVGDTVQVDIVGEEGGRREGRGYEWQMTMNRAGGGEGDTVVVARGSAGDFVEDAFRGEFKVVLNSKL